jgi:hypothetical protein
MGTFPTSLRVRNAGTAFTGQSASGTGLSGTSSSGYGVQGTTEITEEPPPGVAGVRGQAVSGFGVYGLSASGVGAQGSSDAFYGVVGTSGATDKAGVLGRSDGNSTGVIGASGSANPAAPGKTGVYGYASQDANAVGVKGASAAGVGVRGVSANVWGVYGTSNTGIGAQGSSLLSHGLVGTSLAADKTAVYGRSDGDSTGVLGASGANPASPPKTGVFGFAAQDGNARGVTGQTTTGRGINGIATSGVGVFGEATTGYAIRSSGRVRFDDSVGIATIPSGTNSVVVTPGIDLTASSAVVATLQGNPGSPTTTVAHCTVNGSANTFTIRLTRNASANVKVAWHVFE